MHSVVFKNDAVGDLVHSLKAISNIVNSSAKVTIFLSKISENFSFLLHNSKVEIKILNYNLSFFEKIKIIFYLKKMNVKNVYILSPKNFYYYLPYFFKKIKFFAICVNNANNYRRPIPMLRKLLFKYEINDREKIFKRDSTRAIQDRLTFAHNSKSSFSLNINVNKSKELQVRLPKKYIYFHFKKKIFNQLGWGLNDITILFNEFVHYGNNVVFTKDIETDKYNFLFKENFNSYDFTSKKFIDNKKKILFFDNIVGKDLFNVIKYSHKIVAFHGMMTNLGFLLNKPVLDLFHCNMSSWDAYRRYRNSFYEFKPKYNGYDFIIPKKNINKTINKIQFSLRKCLKE